MRKILCGTYFTRWLFSAFRIPHSAEDGVYMGRWQLICTYMCTRLCLSLYLRVCIMYGGRHMQAVYIGIYRAVTSVDSKTRVLETVMAAVDVTGRQATSLNVAGNQS